MVGIPAPRPVRLVHVHKTEERIMSRAALIPDGQAYPTWQDAKFDTPAVNNGSTAHFWMCNPTSHQRAGGVRRGCSDSRSFSDAQLLSFRSSPSRATILFRHYYPQEAEV